MTSPSAALPESPLLSSFTFREVPRVTELPGPSQRWWHFVHGSCTALCTSPLISDTPRASPQLSCGWHPPSAAARQRGQHGSFHRPAVDRPCLLSSPNCRDSASSFRSSLAPLLPQDSALSPGEGRVWGSDKGLLRTPAPCDSGVSGGGSSQALPSPAAANSWKEMSAHVGRAPSALEFRLI